MTGDICRVLYPEASPFLPFYQDVPSSSSSSLQNVTHYVWRSYNYEHSKPVSSAVSGTLHDLKNDSLQTACPQPSPRSQIWRPPVSELNHVPEKDDFEPTYRSIFPSIISPCVKFDHSKSSVFTPVKKKSHSCSICPATFQNSPQLNLHIRGHAGSKPFVCDYPNCSKTFARNEELTRHRRIHSGYKPHLCNTCGKSFGRKDHLSKHRKTHLQVSEKKVYVCSVPGCGHRYTRSDALTRHKSTAHSIPKPLIGAMRKQKLQTEIQEKCAIKLELS